MGKALVDSLSNHNLSYEIHLINRGKIYWYFRKYSGKTKYFKSTPIYTIIMEIVRIKNKWQKWLNMFKLKLALLKITHGGLSLISHHLSGAKCKALRRDWKERLSSMSWFLLILSIIAVPSKEFHLQKMISISKKNTKA